MRRQRACTSTGLAKARLGRVALAAGAGASGGATGEGVEERYLRRLDVAVSFLVDGLGKLLQQYVLYSSSSRHVMMA